MLLQSGWLLNGAAAIVILRNFTSRLGRPDARPPARPHQRAHYQQMITAALGASRKAMLKARNGIDPEWAGRVLRILDQRMAVVMRRD